MKKRLCCILVLFILAGLMGCSDSSTAYKHNHLFKKEIVASTCTHEGYTKYTCNGCGMIAIDDYTQPWQNGGHVYKNCICTDCGDFLIDEAVDTANLTYEKVTDNGGNESYAVTGVSQDAERVNDRLTIEYIKIPSTHQGLPVTQIADKAFYNILSLKHVVIPDSVTSIGESAFQHCFSLLSVTIPDSVSSIENSAFFNCTKLKKVTLPSNLTAIEEAAFMACQSLTEIKIPDGVTFIGVSAFEGCLGLAKLTIPASVTYIYHGAFSECKNLKNIYYKGSKEQWLAIYKEVGEYNNTGRDASWDAYTGEYTVYCIETIEKSDR